MHRQRLAVSLLAISLALSAQAGVPDYDSFSDRDGRITTREHGLGLIKLVSNPGQLEAVYDDAAKGSARAKRVFEELETSYFPDTGRELAELVSRPPCLVPVLRELSGWCVPDWSFLDFLSKDKLAGVRLRVALLNGYLERARQRNLENQLILSAMTSILGASVVANALREAGATTSASSTLETRSAAGAEAAQGASAAGAANAVGSQLRGASQAVIDLRKLTEYALNPEHPVGGNKARVFARLGFDQTNVGDLLKQIQAGVLQNPAVPGKVDQFGARFTVDVPVSGPQGTGIVRTGWIIKSGSEVPELTTLYVK